MLNEDTLRAAYEQLKSHVPSRPIEIILAHPDDFDDIADAANDIEHTALVPTLIHVQVEELITTLSGEDIWVPIMYTMVDDGQNYLLVTMYEWNFSSETKIRLYDDCTPGQMAILYKQDLPIGYRRPIIYETEERDPFDYMRLSYRLGLWG